MTSKRSASGEPRHSADPQWMLVTFPAASADDYIMPDGTAAANGTGKIMCAQATAKTLRLYCSNGGVGSGTFQVRLDVSRADGATFDTLITTAAQPFTGANPTSLAFPITAAERELEPGDMLNCAVVMSAYGADTPPDWLAVAVELE